MFCLENENKSFANISDFSEIMVTSANLLCKQVANGCIGPSSYFLQKSLMIVRSSAESLFGITFVSYSSPDLSGFVKPSM